MENIEMIKKFNSKVFISPLIYFLSLVVILYFVIYIDSSFNLFYRIPSYWGFILFCLGLFSIPIFIHIKILKWIKWAFSNTTDANSLLLLIEKVGLLPRDHLIYTKKKYNFNKERKKIAIGSVKDLNKLMIKQYKGFNIFMIILLIIMCILLLGAFILIIIMGDVELIIITIILALPIPIFTLIIRISYHKKRIFSQDPAAILTIDFIETPTTRIKWEDIETWHIYGSDLNIKEYRKKKYVEIDIFNINCKKIDIVEYIIKCLDNKGIDCSKMPEPGIIGIKNLFNRK